MAFRELSPREFNALPPERQEQYLADLEQALWESNQQAINQQVEANKPPSEDDEIINAAAGLVGLPAGIVASNYAMDAFSGPAAAATTPALETAAAVAPTTAAAPSVGAAAAPASYEAIGSAVGGGQMLGPAGTAAGSGTAAAAPATGGFTSALGMAPGSSILPAIGAAPLAAATAYYTGTGLNNALKGEDLDWKEQAALALPTFGLSFASNEFGSGKDKDQLGRDAVRGRLRESGAIGDDYMVKNADGSTFNIGMDGGARLQNKGGGDRQYFDVDFGDERAGAVAGSTDALAAILAGGDEKLKSDFSGYYTNAALQSGDPVENVRAYFAQNGLDKAKAWSAIDELVKQGRIDEQTGHIYRNSLNNTFGGGAPAPAMQGLSQVAQQTGDPSAALRERRDSGDMKKLLMGYGGAPSDRGIRREAISARMPRGGGMRPYQQVAQALNSVMPQQSGAKPTWRALRPPTEDEKIKSVAQALRGGR